MYVYSDPKEKKSKSIVRHLSGYRDYMHIHRRLKL